MVRLEQGVTLGELITQLVDLDLEDPANHNLPVTVEQDDEGRWWIVIRE